MSEQNQSVSVQELTQALREVIAEVKGPKQVSMAEYEPKTPFNPTASRKRPKLARPTFQNGHRADETLLTDEEIRLFNQIKKSGRYLNRKVEVIIRQSDIVGEPDSVELRYANRTNDQRAELKGLARNLEDMLRQIVAEQGK